MKDVKRRENIGSGFDRAVFGKAIQKCGILKEFESALNILEFMKDLDIKKDVVTYNILFDVYSHQLDYV